MEVDLNEQKHSCIMPFEGSKVELNKSWTLTIEFVIIGKTMTSNVKTVFGNFVVLCESVENNHMVNELDYGLENHRNRERTRQTTGKYDYETRDLRTTTTFDDKLKRPVEKLAPMFYECVFREKNRTDNVGASQLRDQKLNLNVTDETYNSKHLETLSKFQLGMYKFCQSGVM